MFKNPRGQCLIINVYNIRVVKGRNTYNLPIEEVQINSFQLSSGEDSVSVIVNFEEQEESVLVEYDTLPFRVISKAGGGNYGI